MPTTLPIEVDEITAAWVSEVLNADIQAVEILGSHSGTTGRARVAISHQEPTLPASVFVKLAPFDTAQRTFVDQEGMGVSEARFYAELACDVPVRHPHCWYAAHDDAGRYVMVLEDLTTVGARYPSRRDSDLPDFVERTIDAFGALHAAFWASPRFAPDGDLAWIEARSRNYGSSAKLVRFAADQLGGQLPEASARLVEAYLPRAKQMPALLSRGTRTLVHGDAHLGNMFADGTTPGFLDWAMVGVAPGVRDVAYFLGGSTPTELRRAHERALIERYCERLREGCAGADADVDVDEVWDQYRLQLITAWIAAIVTAAMGSKWQPVEVGVAATKSADAAIADHDVAGLLTELLP